MKNALILLLNLAVVASGQITWNKVWPPINNGTHNPPNGYEDIAWDPYTGKVWIYSTNGTNSGDQIYSIRLHYFDPVAISDTNIGDNGQTNNLGCNTSTPSTWPATHHGVGQIWDDAIRHRIHTIQGVGCTEIVLEQWYYQFLSPISGTSWTEVFPSGLATSHTGEVGPWQSAFQNTTLSASISSSATTISVATPVYAVNQDFYLIDSEIVRITANGNTYLLGSGSGMGSNPLTIARGQYGTTATSHSSGATVERLNGTFNNGKVIHDTYHDAFFWFGQRNDNSFGQLFTYCDTSQNPTPGTLTAAQSSVGCTRADDWVDLTSKSICADATACSASAETGTNGSNSGRLPSGWYYPSMDFNSVSNTILLFGGGIYNTPHQYSYVYSPTTFTWTRLTTTCSGADCTGLLSLTVTSGGSGYSAAPTVTINNCTGATANAVMSGSAVASLTITAMGTSCSSPTVGFSGGGGSGAAATAVANTSNAPPLSSYNSEDIRIAHAMYQGKMYYHLSQHTASPAYSGSVSDWVLDPVAQTWTELQTGAGPTYTEAMTVDPATGNLYAWATPTEGTDAEIWQGNIGGANAPSITTTSPLNPGMQSTAYSFSFTTTGAAPITWSVTSGSLPPGLTLTSSGGILSGTPTSSGTYTFAVSATNSVGTAGPQTYSLTITAPTSSAPVITSVSPLPQGGQGIPYAGTLTATGATPITWGASGLPAGLSMSSSGVLSGTPAQTGVYSIAVSASNSAGSVTGNFSLTVASSQVAPVSSGLGHSSYNCVDVDGDGYGVGPGCLGPDADDTDATVYTLAQVLSRYSTLAAFWSHLGYTPVHALHVDGSSGSCTPVSTPFTYSSVTACGTIAAAITAMGTGDAVVIHAGTYAQGASTINMKTGTLSGTSCATTSYYLAYPGDEPVITFAGGSPGLSSSASQSCFTVDGGQWLQTTQGTGRGFGASLQVPMYGWLITHVDISGFTDNIFPQYYQNGTQILNNYIHGAYAGGDFGHDIYLGSNVVASNGTIIRGNVIADAADTCIHANGPMTNITIDSNFIYGCDSPILLQSGVNHSTLQNNIAFTSGQDLFGIGTYYSGDAWQCHDENHNVIRNNTFFMDGQAWMSGMSPSSAFPLLWVADDGTCQSGISYTPDLGHNTYANNIMVHSCGSSCIGTPGPLLRYTGTNSTTYLQTDTWQNNILINLDTTAYLIDPGPVAGYPGIEPCAWFTNTANVPLASGNLCNTNPDLTAANAAWYTMPQNWNLKVTSSSPALAASLASNAPAFDILGAPRQAVPTIGAYEFPPLTSTSPCDLNGDGVVNAADVTTAINQALGTAACTNANLTGSGCNVVDVQRVINAAIGGACVTGP